MKQSQSVREEKIITRALRLLTIRLHSKFELLQKLKKLFPETSTTLLQTIVLRMEQLGYIDEQHLALRTAEYIITRKQKGIPYLSMKLQQLRIPHEYYQEALTYGLELLEQALARYIEKQTRLLPGGISQDQQKKKIKERALRRGFDYDHVCNQLEQFFASQA